MSLFRDIGRKAERFKQTATEKAREVAEPDYRCRDCDAVIDGEVEACPECGSTDLVDPEGSADEGTEESGGKSPEESGDQGPDETPTETPEASPKAASAEDTDEPDRSDED